MKNSKAIEGNNLSKSFKENLVLNNLNFSVSENSFHALVGENGAGKTTLIKIILGLITVFDGKIEIFNVNNKNPLSRSNIFYMPAEAKFPSGISLFKYLLSIALLKNLTRNEARSLIIHNLKKFNLWNFRRKRPNSFSSGQKKKALLISSIISNDKLIILDEPTANLDPKTRREIYNIFSEMKQNGKTIFVSTHNLTEISTHIDEASYLRDGQIFWNGKIGPKVNLEEHYFQKNNTFTKNKGKQNE